MNNDTIHNNDSEPQSSQMRSKEQSKNRQENKRRRSRLSQLRARKKFRRNVVRVIIHTLAWGGVAVLYYTVISLFFDTPYEYALKESTAMLRSEYERLESRYDSLTTAMESIEARDRNIFGIMFESEPYDFTSERDDRLLELYESILEKRNDELRSELEERCNTMQQRIAALQSSTQKMVESIEAARDRSARIPAIQPINNQQLTLLTASYGLRIHPFYKSIHPHQGVDYTIPEGTRVFATADGTIKSYTLSNSTSGKSVVIDHGNGYETSYNHLSKIDIPRSRRVKRGDIIGMSGNTGLSLTPHLHYEVRYNDQRVDPIHYFFMELTPSEYQKIIKIAQSGMQSFD
ncbi:MAG: M23 family metallopeptidase [Rikenellaceae bacterium]